MTDVAFRGAPTTGQRFLPIMSFTAESHLSYFPKADTIDSALYVYEAVAGAFAVSNELVAPTNTCVLPRRYSSHDSPKITR